MRRVTENEKRLLDSWIRAGTTPQRVVRRARIVLTMAEGLTVRRVSERLGVNARTVSLWWGRYRESGPDVLWRDAPGRGRKPAQPDGAARVREVLAEPPPDARWTVRRLAAATGMSRASVHRILTRMNPRSPAEGGQQPTSVGGSRRRGRGRQL
jgi:transposase